MKKLLSPSLLIVTLCTTLVLGCRKEIETTASASVQAVSEENATASSSTKFGVVASGVAGDDRVTVAQNLKVGYVRHPIYLKTFNGKASLMDKYQKNGFKILLNLGYEEINKNSKGEVVPKPFPTNMTEYKNLLKKVLDKYKPEVAVIENEPFNDSYYTGKIENYLTELQTAADVCKSYGVKVADGGLKGERVCILTYRDYVNRGLQAKADDFAKRALSDKNLRLAKGEGQADVLAKVTDMQKMIDAYKSMSSLTYVNLHWYEPFNDVSSKYKYQSAPSVLTEVADYLRRATGKQVISNEFGQNNDSPDLVRSLVNAFRSAGFIYAIDFSADGKTGAVALNTGTKLRPNGITYRDECNKK